MKTRLKILLTGASGTVGQAVLKELCIIKNKYEVTVFDKKLHKTINKFKPYKNDIDIVYGNRLENPLITVDDKLNPSEGDEYAKTKILAENIIQNCELDWTIFRLTAIMGGHKISKLMFHQPLKTSLEIASPEDTARAFVFAIDKQTQLSKKDIQFRWWSLRN